MNLTCPKCNREMKSQSGWTLHVKTCCPEMRWQKTTIEMTVRFEVPVLVDMTNGPVDIFRQAFWSTEQGDAGRSVLLDATVHGSSTATRPPSAMELQRIKKTEDMADKTQSIAEYKRVVREIIGKHEGYCIQTEAHHWPDEATFYITRGLVKRWQRRSAAIFSFKFLKDATLVVNKHTNSSVRQDGVNVFKLADPDCFEKVRKYTGLRP